ncbi:hypothetical protein CPB85DRAFT_1438747 [Mucidula mucida]|nr:hypothetical protein CPB85DRAFT_1438747 [Mucidula mucida]
MAPTFDMNRKANQAALLRSPLLSRTDINAKHNHSASSTSTWTLSSSSEAPRTPPDEAAGVIDHGKELEDVMQTKGVNFYPISSSFSDTSVTRVHPKSLLARITRTNTIGGQRVANERLKGVMSTYTHASSNVSEIKIHRESMLTRIARGSVRPHGGVKGDVTGRSESVIPSATTTVAGNQSTPFLPNGRAIIPGYINNSTIRLCQFIALVMFTAFNGPDSASEFLDSDECSSLTAFVWRTNNSLTAQRYWVGGLKNPAVFRSIVYLLRMFPSKMSINSVDTMKHAFAFISLLGIKYDTDDRVLCKIVCRGLGTPNFDALERLALQVVDYDMLVRNGDWADCSVQVRECMRVLTSKESQEAVGGWLDVIEVCPKPRTALKRSGCIANMDKARILLKALATPEMAASSMAMKDRRMTAAERQAVEKRVLEWVKGIPHTSRRYEGHSATCRQLPSWPPALSNGQSIAVPPSVIAPSRAYAYPYA